MQLNINELFNFLLLFLLIALTHTEVYIFHTKCLIRSRTIAFCLVTTILYHDHVSQTNETKDTDGRKSLLNEPRSDIVGRDRKVLTSPLLTEGTPNSAPLKKTNES